MSEKASPLLQKGIVVESLSSGGEARRAGMQPGDVLLSWNGAKGNAEFESPFDLPYVVFEQAPLGPLRVEGFHDGKKCTWLLHRFPWGLVARPNFADPILSAYMKAEALAHSGKLDEAVQGWRAAVTSEKAPAWLKAWFLYHAGQALFQAKQMEASDDLYQEAIQAAAESGAIVRGELFRQQASQFQVRDEFVSAEDYYRRELLEWRQLGANLLIAKNLNELGSLFIDKGDFTAAEPCFLQSLAISEKLAPVSLSAALSYDNLAVLYQNQGDLGKAEKYYQLALRIERKHFPDTYYLASLLTNLGVLERWRGNIVASEAYHKQALSIANKLEAPLYIARALDNMSDCRRDEGDLAGAEAYQKRALDIREKMAGVLPVADSLAALGKIAQLEEKLDVAEDYYHRALEATGRVNPTPPEQAIFLAGLGDVLRDRGSLPEAEQKYREALALMDQLGPRSFNRAETLVSLAAILRRQGHSDKAVELYKQALGDLEYQTASLGAEETQARYRAKHAGYYREFIDLLIEQGQPELAFETLESSRARSLFEMLAQAQINIRQGADPALLARERSLQQAINAKSQYRIRLLSEKHTEAQMDSLDRDIAALRESHQQLEADIRTSSPAYAALTQPQPPGLKNIQALLDSNTVLVEYSLGEKHSYVWVVGDHSLEMRELPPQIDIERLTSRFYAALTARTHSATGAGAVTNWAKSDRLSQELATSLSSMVLSPIANLIDGKRLLIVSDGALQYVPFAALPVPEKKNLPLLLDHEIVNLPSASVLGEIRRAATGRPHPIREVAILADPVFDPSDERVADRGPAVRTVAGHRGFAAPELLTRSAADTGLGKDGSLYFTRLLSTRQEAQKIMAVTSRRRHFVALDFRASRKMAMDASLKQYRIIHFATHGLLDSRHPELSGLVFSLVNQQGKPVDGFVGLQDIYNLNLPVDLVVLSACETALGENISGEGLIGLTRGFMYAGSSRVVASLWNISDEATSELMARFYKAMELQGMAPAAALRSAQIQMWRQKRWAAPYYWAAFQIQGEWK